MNFKKIVTLFLLLLFSAFAINESLLYSQNHLFKNPNWKTYKENFIVHLAGGIESVTSRVLLAQNHFVTNENFGSQLMTSRSLEEFTQLRFDFFLGSQGYLDILFNGQNNLFQGLRISLHKSYPSKVFSVDTTGQFFNSIPFSLLDFHPGHHQAIILQKNNKLILMVDEKIIRKLEQVNFKKLPFGFHTSTRDLEIYSVKLKYNGNAEKELVFNAKVERINFFVKNLILILIISFSFYLFSFFVFPKTKLNFMDFQIDFFKWLSLVSILWLSFDYLYYSRIPQFWNYRSFAYASHADPEWSDFEHNRFRFFRSWYQFVGGEIITEKNLQAEGIHFGILNNDRLCSSLGCKHITNKLEYSEKKVNDFRIINIGGSFSGNSGVTDASQSFFDFFSLHLVNFFKKKALNVQLLNLSYIGTPFNEMIKDLKVQIDHFHPDSIILSFYLMGQGHENEKEFSEFVKFLNIKKIHVFFFEPVRNLEEGKNQNHIYEYYRILHEVQKKLKISYFPSNLSVGVNEEFNSRGFIFWDDVHMTNFGQQQFAQILFQEYIKSLP